MPTHKVSFFFSARRSNVPWNWIPLTLSFCNLIPPLVVSFLAVVLRPNLFSLIYLILLFVAPILPSPNSCNVCQGQWFSLLHFSDEWWWICVGVIGKYLKTIIFISAIINSMHVLFQGVLLVLAKYNITYSYCKCLHLYENIFSTFFLGSLTGQILNSVGLHRYNDLSIWNILRLGFLDITILLIVCCVYVFALRTFSNVKDTSRENLTKSVSLHFFTKSLFSRQILGNQTDWTRTKTDWSWFQYRVVDISTWTQTLRTPISVEQEKTDERESTEMDILLFRSHLLHSTLHLLDPWAIIDFQCLLFVLFIHWIVVRPESIVWNGLSLFSNLYHILCGLTSVTVVCVSIFDCQTSDPTGKHQCKVCQTLNLWTNLDHWAILGCLVWLSTSTQPARTAGNTISTLYTLSAFSIPLCWFYSISYQSTWFVPYWSPRSITGYVYNFLPVCFTFLLLYTNL